MGNLVLVYSKFICADRVTKNIYEKFTTCFRAEIKFNIYHHLFEFVDLRYFIRIIYLLENLITWEEKIAGLRSFYSHSE